VSVVLHRPAPPFDADIECVWHDDGSGESGLPQRVVPTGGVDIVFDLASRRVRIHREDRDMQACERRGPVVSGPHTRSFVMEVVGGGPSVGVGFRPGAAGAFLGVPLGEVAGMHVSLADIWGARAAALRDRLGEATSVREALRILEDAIRRRPVGMGTLSPAVRHALRRFDGSPGMPRVGEVVRTTGYSARHFKSLFTRAVGLTPKAYCRVRRIQAVIERLRLSTGVDWAGVALAAGYCDQSHLIREFRSLVGVTPRAYLAASPDRSNHVRVA
jgi:AraC-like DNA-binding protein